MAQGMKVQDAITLFNDTDSAVNHFHRSSVQVNLLHPLLDLPPEGEVSADFLSAPDAIVTNLSFRLTRANVLYGVISDIEKTGKNPDLLSKLKAFELTHSAPAFGTPANVQM